MEAIVRVVIATTIHHPPRICGECGNEKDISQFKQAEIVHQTITIPENETINDVYLDFGVKGKDGGLLSLIQK